uniref:Papilin n=1 Tax=Lygus hesperus TaxID=30085 RepID=A0A146L5I0_LYGHE
MLMVRCVVWLLTVIGAVVDGGDLVEPITAVKRGFRNRVEYISAEINKNHLDKGSAPSAAADAYVRRMTVFNDDSTGQLIPGNLGGTGNETYNFIPMNCFISGLWRHVVEQPVYNSVSQGNVVKLSIALTYDNATSTRPSKLVFNIGNNDSKILVKNSTLDNPVPMFPCHHAVIPQSQIVSNETKITTVTTITVTNTTVFVPNPLCRNDTGNNVTNSNYCKGAGLFQTLFPKPVATQTPLSQDLGATITNQDKIYPQTTSSSIDGKYLTTSTSEKPPYNQPVETEATDKPRPVPSPTSSESGFSTTTESGYSTTSTVESDSSTATERTKPVSYYLNTKDHVKAGTNLTLTCLLNQDIKEVVTFTWRKNDMPMAPIEGRVVPQGNHLVIANADKEDSGNYTCLFDYNGRRGISDSVAIVVQRTLLHPECIDNKFLADCTVVLKAKYCFHKYYSKFCCKSCTEDGQLPAHQPGAQPPWMNIQAHKRRLRSSGRLTPPIRFPE